MSMPNVDFYRGNSADLIKADGSPKIADVTHGAFYYTEDEHKLYMGYHVGDVSRLDIISGGSGNASVDTYRIHIPTGTDSAWESNETGGYRLELTSSQAGYAGLSSIVDTDEPIVDVLLGSFTDDDGNQYTNDDDKANLAAWYCISRIDTINQGIVLYAYETKPTTDFWIIMKVIKK